MMNEQEQAYMRYHSALEGADLSPSQKMTALYLAKRFYLSGDNTPSAEEIASAIGAKSLKTVYRANAVLEEAGWITVNRRGITLTNRYAVQIPR